MLIMQMKTTSLILSGGSAIYSVIQISRTYPHFVNKSWWFIREKNKEETKSLQEYCTMKWKAGIVQSSKYLKTSTVIVMFIYWVYVTCQTELGNYGLPLTECSQS